MKKWKFRIKKGVLLTGRMTVSSLGPRLGDSGGLPTACKIKKMKVNQS